MEQDADAAKEDQAREKKRHRVNPSRGWRVGRLRIGLATPPGARSA
jgi:hypothetical protein